jgi:hypothetical protein
VAIDYTTPAGRVRLLAADTDETDPVLTNDQVDAFLAIEGDNIQRAAALALETIAVDQALVLKVIKTLDVSTDGAKVADTLLKRAAVLRAQADQVDEDADDDFAVAEFADPVFGYRDRMRRQILRGRA